MDLNYRTRFPIDAYNHEAVIDRIQRARNMMYKPRITDEDRKQTIDWLSSVLASLEKQGY